MALRSFSILALCMASCFCGTQASVCFKADYDAGALGGDCGYAKEVKVYAGPGYNFSAHSWIASKKIPTESVVMATMLDSPGDCQVLCATTPMCAYFSYEPAKLCVLKEAYQDMETCGATYKAKAGLTSGPAVCPSCFKQGYDFGAVGGNCGYAKEVKIYAGPGYNFSAHSWIASKKVPTESVATATMLDSAADCQLLCMQTSGCEYFAFEPGGKLCVLKQSYADMIACVPHYKPKDATVSGPVMCSNCVAAGYDIGGGNNVCGYAKEIKMYGSAGYNFSAHSWLASKGIPSEIVSKLQSVEDCQMLCKMHDSCAYYIYNYESKGIPRCLLKEAYKTTLCEPLHKESATDVSGTAYCPSAKTTCGELKNFYRASQCCGNPSKAIFKVKV